MRTSKCYDAKNLDFLADFVRQVSPNVASFAERAGISKQLLGHYFRHDDIKLSKLRSILDTVGYQIEFSYRKKNAVEKSWKFEFRPCDGPVVNEEDKNIAFVFDMLRELNITYGELADRIGAQYATVVYWLVNSKDMDVSVVKLIAEKMGLELNIRIFPKDVAE